jgi:hypothetical protein
MRALAAMSTCVLARRLPRSVAVALSTVCFVTANRAHAAAEPVDDGVHEPADAHAEAHALYHSAFVLKIAHVETRTIVGPRGEAEQESAVAEKGVERRSALGITFEHVLVEGWLNAEVGTLLSSEPGGQLAFPSTVLLKVPADIAEAVEGYVGAGVAVELEREQQWTPNWGAAAALGVYVWIAPETGFNFDFEQSFLLSEGVVAELAVGAGVVTRF